jgi:hypothetical protein
MIIVKCTSNSTNWIVYNAATGNTHWHYLNATNAAGANSAAWNNTSPTSSVFSLGNDGDVNGSGRTYIAYCFAEKTGYSKIGTYRGNVTTDNTFIYTGFKVSFWMVKNVDDPTNWMMFDDKRIGYNQTQGYTIGANENNAESGSTGYNHDLLSNGIKLRASNNNFSKDNDYIYMAFGQSLVGSNNTPCTAR